MNILRSPRFLSVLKQCFRKGLLPLLPAIFPTFNTLYGQAIPSTCQGSLGDPTIHIDFGSGESFGPPLDLGLISYNYVPGETHGEGEYTLANNLSHAKQEWHTIEDRTPGDVNGYMLVVNASYDPGEFYRQRVSVCRNTLFEFSAWIINANAPPTCVWEAIRPNVLFRIEDLDGNLIDEVATGDIEPTEIPTWQQYGFTFNTGDQTDFYVVMINNNPGGCGNDLAIDDITFRACGPSLEATALTMNEVGTIYLCPGTAVDLESSISAGFDHPLYQWQSRRQGDETWVDLAGETGTNLHGIVATENRQYRVVAANNPENLASQFCRVVSNPVTLTLVPPITILDQPADLSTCLNESPFFEIRAAGGYPEPDYRWEISSGPAGPWIAATPAQESASPHRLYPQTAVAGEYYYRCIVSSSAMGCEEIISETAKITVLPPLVTLDLPVKSMCADDASWLLSGGLPLNEGPDKTGIYSGPGVSNGHFDPRAAGGPGTYEITYTLRNTTGCQYVAADLITVFPAVLAEAGPDKMMLEGTHTDLEGAAGLENGTDHDGRFTYSWSPATGLDDPTRPKPRASPTESTTYTLTVTAPNGCSSTDQVRVQVLRKLVIPSAFTPNQDGVNDTWEIEGITDYPNASVKVFNRWGSLIFHSRGYPVSWDGTSGNASIPPGVYYYLIDPGIFLPPISGSLTIIQ